MPHTSAAVRLPDALLETPTPSRQARFKASMTARGFVQCNVWVPGHAVPDLQLQAERLREFPHLTVGTLRDPESGKLVSIHQTKHHT